MAQKLKVSEVNEKKLISNIFYLLIVQFVNYLMPLVTLPFLTKMLSIEDFGKVILMYSVSILALVVSEFGFNITGPYYVVKNIENKNKLNIFYNNVLVVKFLVSLAYCLLFILLNYFFKIYNFSFFELIAISFLIITQAFQFSWYFQGIEKMKEITKASIFSKIFYFLGIIIVIPFFKNAFTVIILYVLSQIILAVFYQRSLKIENIYFGKKYIKFTKIKKIFLNNISFFISRLAVIGYTMLNSMILGLNEGLKIVAIYGIAEKIYQVALGVLAPITQAFYPYMIKNKKFNLFSWFLIIGVIFLSLGCYILSIVDEIIISLIFGEAYKDASHILNYFYFLIIIVFLSMNIGHPLLGAIGKLKEVNYTVYIGFIIFILLLFFRGYSLNVLLQNIIIVELMVLLIRLFYVIIAMKENRFIKV